MNVFILIAAYNEAETIEEVIQNLLPLNYRIIVIDDGSTDSTRLIATQCGVTVLSHSINLGQGAALQTGIEYARISGADFMITFDADGQHQANDIMLLLAALNNTKADVALGSRFLGKAINIPYARKLLLYCTVKITNFIHGTTFTDTHNGLRAFRVATTKSIQITQNRMAHASEIIEQIILQKLSYVEVPCTIVYTTYSVSKGQRLIHMLDILFDLCTRRLMR